MEIISFTLRNEIIKKIMNLIKNDLSEPYTIYTYRYFLHQWTNLCFLCVDQDASSDALSENPADGASCAAVNNPADGASCTAVNNPADGASCTAFNDSVDKNKLVIDANEIPSQEELSNLNVIGVIICRLEMHRGRNNDRMRGYIGMLAVSKTHRGKGIGRKLAIRAIEELKSQGAEEVVLETEITNIAALNLYEKLGFVKDKRLPRYYMSGIDAFRLKLWFR